MTGTTDLEPLTDPLDRLEKSLAVPLSVMGGYSYEFNVDDIRSVVDELRARRAAEEAHRGSAASMEEVARALAIQCVNIACTRYAQPMTNGQVEDLIASEVASLLAQVRAQAMAECAGIAESCDNGLNDGMMANRVAAAIRSKAAETGGCGDGGKI